MDLTTAKKKLTSHKAQLKRKYKVKSIGIFGSFVRGEQTKKSDLDVLVEFSQAPSLLEFVGMKDDLTSMMGVKVDLVMKSALRKHLGRAILREVVAV